MKLNHLTDIHLTTPGQTIGDRDPEAGFLAALAHVTDAHPDAEAIVVTGDLSDWGDEADYVRLRGHVEGHPVPVHLCIGDHDDRDTFLGVFSGGARRRRVRPVRRGPCRAATRCSSTPSSPRPVRARSARRGRPGSTRRWPPCPAPSGSSCTTTPCPPAYRPWTGSCRSTRTGWARCWAAIPAGSPTSSTATATWRCGHCHMALSGAFRGVPFSAPRGTNHAGWPDFASPGHLAAADLNPAHGLAIVSDAGTMVHMIEHGYEGQVRREGPPDHADWNRPTMVR